MNVLILSDTHGQVTAAQRVIRAEKPNYLIHLGDTLRDAQQLEALFPYLPICAVPGNNDWFCDHPKEKAISLGNERIFLCHGHTTNVKYGTELQLARTVREGCTVSLFGHTHRPLLREKNGILLLNPGSLTYSGTYAVLTLGEGERRAEIRNEKSE